MWLFQQIKNGLGILGCTLLLGWMQPLSAAISLYEPADPQNLKVYLQQIIGPPGVYRNHKNIEELNRVSAWIKEQMRLFGIPCQYQTYPVNGKSYRNVVCHLKVGRSDRVILGAHYDVHGNQKGADDNASGVAGLIEIARILSQEKTKLPNNVEFVFYTLQEAPYYQTEFMGSQVHAKSILAEKEHIQAVYVLEMIGYYDSRLIQQYPMGLKWIYPSHGNYIAAISNFQSNALGEQYCQQMRLLDKLQCERLVMPAFVSAAGFSDHRSYWQHDIPALLITDTSHYRNPNYHTEKDTLDTLNVTKMGQVIDGLIHQLLGATP